MTEQARLVSRADVTANGVAMEQTRRAGYTCSIRIVVDQVISAQLDFGGAQLRSDAHVQVAMVQIGFGQTGRVAQQHARFQNKCTHLQRVSETFRHRCALLLEEREELFVEAGTESGCEWAAVGHERRCQQHITS